MAEDEARNTRRGAGSELSVTRRRAVWMRTVIGVAAVASVVAVAVACDGADDVVGPGITSMVTMAPTIDTTVLTTVTTDTTVPDSSRPTVPASEPMMEVLTGTLFGLRIGDVVDVDATIARIDALASGAHTFDSGWHRVPNDPSIDSCYDDSDYRGLMWGDVTIIFNGTDAQAEVLRWTVGDTGSSGEEFFLGQAFPAPDGRQALVSTEGIGVGTDAGDLRPPDFDEPVDRGDGTVAHGVAVLGSQGVSLPQPFAVVYSVDGIVTGILVDAGRC